MENSTVPGIFFSTPIDTGYLQTLHKKSSLDELRRAPNPTAPEIGIYARSRPTSSSIDGDSKGQSVRLVVPEYYPGFDYSGFSRAFLKQIRRDEGPRNLSLGINLPSDFSASTSTLGTGESQGVGEGDRSSQDTIITAYHAPRHPRVHFERVADEGGTGHSMFREDSDAKSVASSAWSTSSGITITPLRTVQRVVSKVESKSSELSKSQIPDASFDLAEPQDTKLTARKRSPSVYKVIRKHIVKALTGKSKYNFDASTTVIINNHYHFDPPRGTPVVNPVAEFPTSSERVKSSSASIFSVNLKRRPTVDCQKTIPAEPPVKPAKRAFSIRSRGSVRPAAQANTPTWDRKDCDTTPKPRTLKRGLQRSASFSGFTDLSLSPARYSIGEQEAIQEALRIAQQLGGKWPLYRAPVESGECDAMGDGFIFERNIESRN